MARKPIFIILLILLGLLFVGIAFLVEQYVQKSRKPITTVRITTTVQGLDMETKAFDLGSGVKLEMVHIPAGSFRMGTDPDKFPGKQSPSNIEMPAHTVNLSDFWIGRYEVTQKQYEAIMGANPSDFKGPTNPVETVSWEDATQFCKNLSAQAGTSFTLPTEAQWEYACRAGTTTKYYWGDSMDEKYAWYDDNSGSTTHPVGKKRPNIWGLHNMSGNVVEWCSDWYGDYSSATQTDLNGPSSGMARVARGGCWLFIYQDCRSAARFAIPPGGRGFRLGFRVVAVPETVK